MAKKRTGLVIEGLPELNATFARAYAQAPVVATRTLRDCILDLAGESARRAPVDTGDLRSNCVAKIEDTVVFEERQVVSSTVHPTARVSGTVGYSLPYALRQHEGLDFNHPRGGEAKFLERPYLERKEMYIRRIKTAMGELL